MCPDAELISAYADGEVPSPWRERLAAHLQSCPSCALRLADFSRLGTLLRSAGGEEEALAARVSARLAARLEPRFAAWKAPRRRVLASEVKSFALRSITLPLPFAAAAALALVFFTGVGLTLFLRPAAAPTASVAAADIAPGTAQGASMEALIRYLEAQDAQVNLTIRLPPSATFASTGSPLIVTAPPKAYAPYPAPVEEPPRAATAPDSASDPAGSSAPAEAEDPALSEAKSEAP